MNTTDISLNSREETYTTGAIISDSLLLSLELFLNTPMHTAASSAGVVTNFLNMWVQSRLGLKTSVSVGVFALSLTDFFVTLIDLAIIACYLLSQVTRLECDVDVNGLGVHILAWFRYPGFFISSWITTVMSAEKCLAVVAPLRVKQVFTRRRTVFVIVFVYALYLSVVLSIYSSLYMDRRVVSVQRENGTMSERLMFSVVFTDNAADLERAIDITCAFVLSVLSQTILIFSTAAMVYHLKISSRIRHRKTPGAHNLAKLSATAGVAQPESNLTSKERRMVKVVLCLSVVLIVCNVPRYVNIIVYCAFPGFLLGAHQNLSWIMWTLNDFLITLNCSSHFIVYWMLNRKFRRCCSLLFRFNCLCLFNNRFTKM